LAKILWLVNSTQAEGKAKERFTKRAKKGQGEGSTNFFGFGLPRPPEKEKASQPMFTDRWRDPLEKSLFVSPSANQPPQVRTPNEAKAKEPFPKLLSHVPLLRATG
jgi:hypothetical protein